MKIRTWDKIEVISWKDKWTRSEIVRVFTDTNKVIVKDVNVVTKHVKKMGTNPGQIVKMEKAIDVSNIMLVCPFTDKITKIGFVTIEEKGKAKKFRFSKVAAKEQGKKANQVIIK